MSQTISEFRFVEEGKCPACGSNLVPTHARRPRVDAYTDPHCAPCATGIERREA